MKLNLIWCQSSNNVIGQIIDGEYFIPWKCSFDMQFFKEQTTGKAVLMGYNTWKSIDEKPLINRENFVLTTKHYDELNVLFDKEGNPNLIHPVKTISEAIRICEFLGLDELWIIGGKSVYETVIKEYSTKIDKIYRTVLYTSLAVDKNSIIMPDIPKSLFRMMNIKKFKEGQIETYQLH